MGNAESSLGGIPVNTPLKVTDMRDLQPYIDDAQQTLKVLNTGGGLVKHLGKESKLCQYIYNGDIKMRFFAGGEEGQVADISFPGMGTKKYIVKAVKELREVIVVSDDYLGLTIQGVWDAAISEEDLDYDTYLELNGGNPDRLLRRGDSIILPSFAQECLTKSATEFTNTADPTKTVSYPAGSYLCEQTAYSEYVNSLLVGELIRSGISINFINTFNFATCYRGKAPKSYIERLVSKGEYDASEADTLVVQYTFMEKIDGVVLQLVAEKKSQIPQLDAEILFVQILHAMATYQATYKLQHNDLHLANVFYETVKPGMLWHNQRLDQADYFSYRTGDTALYLPAIKYIAKIADWGLSVKYSTPVVGDKRTLRDGYDGWMVNFYNETYDLLYTFNALFMFYPNSKFFIAVGDWLVGDIAKLSRYLDSSNLRPILSKLLEAPLKGKTAADLLQDHQVMALFMRPPVAGSTVIELGTVGKIPAAKRQSPKKTKAKATASPKRARPATRSTAPAKLSCAQLTSLSVSALTERLLPLALSPETLIFFERNRMTGQTLVDFYDIDQYRSLSIPETDRIRLAEYVKRCTSV